MKNIRAFLMIFLCFKSLLAEERISSFTSNIIVQDDATLLITESFEVICEGKQIVHGLVREFPISYKDNNGINYQVCFNLKSVKHNGNVATYKTESVSNGKKIYIGNKNVILPHGKHIYTITYETNYQLGFFNNYDELYWNVTGNCWQLPIDKVTVKVKLPIGIPSEAIKAFAYTGLQGSQDCLCSHVINNNIIFFSTTARLQVNEGFTIVVTFPKGFITEPLFIQKVKRFYRDNFLLTLLILCLFLLIIINICLLAFSFLKKKGEFIIPLSCPPENMTPSQVGFINALKFKDTFLSADIVDMAIHGFITIECKSDNSYVLNFANETPASSLSPEILTYYQELLSIFFKNKNVLIISEENAHIIQKALKKCKFYLKSSCKPYVKSFNGFLYLNRTLFTVFFLLLFIQIDKYLFLLITITIFLIIRITSKNFYNIYTPLGESMNSDIKGFKTYLAKRKISSKESVENLPIKTPELYEKHLPYAIALNLETNWTNQFLEPYNNEEGYESIDYLNWHFRKIFKAKKFSSGLSKSISSSSTPPSKSSGSGNNGFSGGGGGGGGGGGW